MKTQEHIVDLHIHSKYARATSPQLTLENIYAWGKIKGIHIIGTGDFTHPQWFRAITENLEPAEDGLYAVKKELADSIDPTIPESCKNEPMRFVPTVEISNIYSRGGHVRKVHNVIVMPSIEAAGKLNKKLSRIGNLAADGRPILGLDSHELLLYTLDIAEDALFIPAHIWTPWFALFGSKSGFDSLEEAFGDDKKHIHAIETGLSSDPYMNWQIQELQNLTVVSNSDAHSLQKLGREANIIESELTYKGISSAIRTNDQSFKGTIEFFPQEGKYHWDGHRKCSFSCSPEQTDRLKKICPVCGKALTVGVDYRVHQLSNTNKMPKNEKSVEYIIPLSEVIADMKGLKSDKAKSVVSLYDKVIEQCGNEFHVLRNAPLKDIEACSVELAYAIKQLRKGKVSITPGYDGEYGKISIEKQSQELFA